MFFIIIIWYWNNCSREKWNLEILLFNHLNLDIQSLWDWDPHHQSQCSLLNPHIHHPFIHPHLSAYRHRILVPVWLRKLNTLPQRHLVISIRLLRKTRIICICSLCFKESFLSTIISISKKNIPAQEEHSRNPHHPDCIRIPPEVASSPIRLYPNFFAIRYFRGNPRALEWIKHASQRPVQNPQRELFR